MNRCASRPSSFTSKGFVTLSFKDAIEMAEVAGTLMLAELAAESVHGPTRLELDAHCEIDRTHRQVRIDASTEAGKTLALVFVGYCRKEFGADAVNVVRGGEEVQS